ncbi:phage major capsid protein [Heyndrickxia ginsengihumi]|uniref:phage major capsid protein n=1 Tax=Heyndrickxia ginsengihumi TaxID=363870 RepID=UPI00046F28DB|nr:phage major capsid protein [Heyndrickxia ginsengihumi]
MLDEKIKELRNQIKEKREEVNAKIEEAQTRAAEGDMESATKLSDVVDQLKQAINELQSKLVDLEKVAGLEPEQVDNQQNPEQKSNEIKGEKRNMEKVKEILKPENEEVRGFEEYIRSKGEIRENVTTVEAQAIIPKDVVTTPQETPETVVDLRSLANVVSVNRGSGSYPVLANPTDVLVSVEELAKNPELAKPNFSEIDYKVVTYRGAIPISQEALEDTDINLGGLVNKHIQKQALNTSNAKIAEVLKSFTAKTATSLDDIKHILNVDIDPAYNVSVVATQSFFNALDTLKDSQGRYLLQQDITSPSGYKLLGRNVRVVKDELLGVAGDQKAFIGDVKAGVFFADRKQASVQWVDNYIYGQVLASFLRFDVKQADAAAGYFVTLDLATEASD